MLPLYTDDETNLVNKSTFRIRQRASTPGVGRRRRPHHSSGTAVQAGMPPPGDWSRGPRSDEVTILIPKDNDGDDDDEESNNVTTVKAAAAAALSKHNTPQQRNRHYLYDPPSADYYGNKQPWNINNNNKNNYKSMDSYEHQEQPHHHQHYYYYSCPSTGTLEDYHTVFRTPHHVTDAEYQRYLRGESSRRPIPGPSSSPFVITKVQCANFCLVFSIIATILLSFIGYLLDTQALYIRGTLPAIPVQSTVDVHGTIRNQFVYEYLIPDTERLPIATTAYRTAGLYCLCSLMAYYYLYRISSSSTNHSSSSSYTTIPETLPTFVVRASHDSIWQRMVRRVKRHARYRRTKQEKKG